MGGCARARWAAAALGLLGLLCAVLGAVMIISVPSIIKQQVHKVGDGRRRGLEGLGAEQSNGEGPLPTSPVLSPARLRLGAKRSTQGLCWRLVGEAWMTDHAGACPRPQDLPPGAVLECGQLWCCPGSSGAPSHACAVSATTGAALCLFH